MLKKEDQSSIFDQLLIDVREGVVDEIQRLDAARTRLPELLTVMSGRTIKRLDLSYVGIDLNGARHLGEWLKSEDCHLLQLDVSGGGFLPKEGVVAIAEGIKCNQNVKQLLMYQLKFGAEGAKAIADMLKVNKTLETLSVSNNELGPEGLRLLLSEGLGCLKCINLLSNNFGSEGACELGAVLKKNTSLTFLYAANNFIGSRGAHSLAEALVVNRTLLLLDISNNRIEQDGGAALFEALEVHNKALTHLDVSRNTWGHLPVVLKQNRHLKILDVGSCEMGPLSFETDTLEELWFARNLMGGENNVQILVESLKKSKNMKHIDLGYNELSTQDIQVLMEALRYGHLRRLNLRDIMLGPKGMVHVAHMLKWNTDLQHLNINDHDMQHEGARALAQALAINTTLTSLEFTDYDLEPEDLSLIIETIEKSNGSLIHSEDGADDMQRLCQRNRDMHQNTLQKVVTLLAARKYQRSTFLNSIPKELIIIIATMLWKTRVQIL